MAAAWLDPAVTGRVLAIYRSAALTGAADHVTSRARATAHPAIAMCTVALVVYRHGPQRWIVTERHA